MTKSHAMVNIGRHLRSQMDVCMMFVTLGGGLLPPTPPGFPKPLLFAGLPGARRHQDDDRAESCGFRSTGGFMQID